MLETIYNFDLHWFFWFNQWALAKPWLDTLIVFFADTFMYVIVAALLLFGVFSLLPMFPRARTRLVRNWEMIFAALLAGGVARFGVVQVIRIFWHRPRPFDVLLNLHQLLAHDPGASFPSGHAAQVNGGPLIIRKPTGSKFPGFP